MGNPRSASPTPPDQKIALPLGVFVKCQQRNDNMAEELGQACANADDPVMQEIIKFGMKKLREVRSDFHCKFTSNGRDITLSSKTSRPTQ